MIIIDISIMSLGKWSSFLMKKNENEEGG